MSHLAEPPSLLQISPQSSITGSIRRQIDPIPSLLDASVVSSMFGGGREGGGELRSGRRGGGEVRGGRRGGGGVFGGRMVSEEVRGERQVGVDVRGREVSGEDVRGREFVGGDVHAGMEGGEEVHGGRHVGLDVRSGQVVDGEVHAGMEGGRRQVGVDIRSGQVVCWEVHAGMEGGGEVRGERKGSDEDHGGRERIDVAMRCIGEHPASLRLPLHTRGGGLGIARSLPTAAENRDGGLMRGRPRQKGWWWDIAAELHLTPAEAYAKLHRIVSEVNSIYSALRSHSYFSLLSALEDNPSTSSSSSAEDLPEDIEDDDDDEDAFQPLKGNVVFACALDGWGFRPQQFAELFAKKSRVNATAFLRGLWGPRYYDKEKKRVVGKKAMKSADPQPMFVEFVLKNLWKVYQLVLTEGGESKKVQDFINIFNLGVPKRELQNKDPKVVLQSVMTRWLPLADAVMDMVVECTPDPVAAQAIRVVRLMPKREVATEDAAGCPEVVAEAERVRKCVEACDVSSDAPVVIYVSKMFAVPYKMLPLKGVNGELLNHHGASESEECFMAFARVFSGVLRAGQKVFVLSPLYDPVKGDAMQKHVQAVELQYLYEMLGQGLKPVTSVGAGNVVAIQGLGQHILKSATLSSTKNCWPFSSMMFQASPMLKVAIEPSNPSDLGALVKGLKLLNRADPFVEYTVSQRGEHVLAAAGEIHLERCIKDLEERFAKVKLVVSDPLVSFKETIEGEGVSLMEGLKAQQDFVERTTPNGRCTVRVQVLRLPNALTKVLEESEQLLGQIIEGKTAKRDGVLDPRLSQDDGDSAATVRKRMIDAIDSELEAISNQVDKEKLERYRKTWLGYLQRIWSLGPWQVGPNLLLLPDVKSSGGAITIQDGRQGILVCGRSYVSERLGFVSESDPEANNNLDNGESASDAPESLHQESMALRNSVVSGFQIATNAGPLCDEPMWGLAFIVEPYIFADSSDTSNHSDQYNLFSGQAITAVKEACRAAVLQNRPRLVEAMYFCELTTPTEQLGATYAVLGKKRARVLKEEMQEGTSVFTVHAYLPVAESVGFSNQLRSITAGAVSALLVLSHWEAIPEDPFFIPKTQDELEEFGDGSSIGPNLAKKLMNSVRRRKGLHVEEKVVEHGTKQRTLAKKV